MGMYLDNSVGYGLMVPYTDDEFDGDLPQEWEALVEKYDGDTQAIFEDLLEDYEGLAYDITYYTDYSGPAVIFVDALSTSHGGFGAVRLTDKVLNLDTFEHDKKLLEIAYNIGMPTLTAARSVGIWSVVSYG